MKYICDNVSIKYSIKFNQQVFYYLLIDVLYVNRIYTLLKYVCQHIKKRGWIQISAQIRSLITTTIIIIMSKGLQCMCHEWNNWNVFSSIILRSSRVSYTSGDAALYASSLQSVSFPAVYLWCTVYTLPCMTAMLQWHIFHNFGGRTFVEDAI